MESNTKGLYTGPITDLQTMAHDTGAKVDSKFVQDGSGPLVNMDDRKTGKVSAQSTKALQGHAENVH